MAFLEVKNVAIKGISACVPKNKENIADIYLWPGMDQFCDATGIRSRRRSLESQTAADLCQKSAEILLDKLNWRREDIDIIIFVSQTPDYVLPATASILQNKLDLPTTCYCLDVSLGCSGWVYALSVITSLMQTGMLKKGILMSGDTVTKLCSTEDKGTYPLFGDAGSATALEYDEKSKGFLFNFNNDGSGYDAIIVREGGSREPLENLKDHKRWLELEGSDVFSFGISKAPKSVRQLCERYSINLEEVDLVTFHQANLMMNEMIRKKLKLSETQVPYSLCDFGNTSCASIPLTLVTKEAETLKRQIVSHICCGFGVGLSWGSVSFTTDHIIVPELMEI